jgi:hypothetical protein
MVGLLPYYAVTWVVGGAALYFLIRAVGAVVASLRADLRPPLSACAFASAAVCSISRAGSTENLIAPCSFEPVSRRARSPQ